MPLHKIFDKGDLTPTDWRVPDGESDFHTYNPSIFRHNGDLLMAVRICGPDRNRKIAMLRLDHQFDRSAAPPVPLSDHFRFRNPSQLDAQSLTWFAEPRLFSLGKRLFMHFNNGGVPPNRIFMVELDPTSLLPLGEVREVERVGSRKDVEKNWIFFGHGGTVFALYEHCPFELLEVDFSGPGNILCRTAYRHQWDAVHYARDFGELRGGTTPVHDGSRFVTMFHSAYVHQDGRIMEYVGGLLRFEPAPPFRPLDFTGRKIIRLRESETALPRCASLNTRPKKVLYPCGLIRQHDNLIVSYGINDEYAALRQVDFEPEDFERITISA